MQPFNIDGISNDDERKSEYRYFWTNLFLRYLVFQPEADDPSLLPSAANDINATAPDSDDLLFFVFSRRGDNSRRKSRHGRHQQQVREYFVPIFIFKIYFTSLSSRSQKYSPK